MSKFDELCKSYVLSREKYMAYEEDCLIFAKQLADKFIAYLEVPKNNISFVPADKAPEDRKKYSLFSAINLSDDDFWHFGMQIILYEKPNKYPHQPILLLFRLKKKNNLFYVKIPPYMEEKTIDPAKEKNFTEFFDYLFNEIKSYFEKGLQKYHEGAEAVKTIGFIEKD